jgi:uncharacterized protein YjbJ (UPF0337 family)
VRDKVRDVEFAEGLQADVGAAHAPRYKQERKYMTALELKGNWNVVKGKLKQKWGSLTDDDLHFVEGQEEELIGRIQRRTGQKREAVERFLREESGPVT